MNSEINLMIFLVSYAFYLRKIVNLFKYIRKISSLYTPL